MGLTIMPIQVTCHVLYIRGIDMSDDWQEEKKEYKIYPNHMEEEDYLKVLLTDGDILINNGWWDKTWPNDRITVAVICNDVFAWGCADAEEILYSDLKEIYEVNKKDPNWGIAVWCMKKRNLMPQKPVEDIIRKEGIWDLDSMNLRKNGN